MPAPAISIIVPDCHESDSLAQCVDGFAAQTLARDRFELILEDGETDPCAMRNAAVRRARSPVVVFFSCRLRPFPQLLDVCLQFHSAHPPIHHASLLCYAADSIWRRLRPAPEKPGVQTWQAFDWDALTAKTAIFEKAQFNPAYGCMAGAELALRLSRRIDLTLCYEPVITAERVESMGLEEACEAHYLAAYHQYSLSRAYPGVVPYAPGEMVANNAELVALLAAARELGRRAAQPDFAGRRMLDALRCRLEEHARAAGWKAAHDGKPPDLSAILGSRKPAGV